MSASSSGESPRFSTSTFTIIGRAQRRGRRRSIGVASERKQAPRLAEARARIGLAAELIELSAFEERSIISTGSSRSDRSSRTGLSRSRTSSSDVRTMASSSANTRRRSTRKPPHSLPRTIPVACARVYVRSFATERASAAANDQTFDNLGTFVLDIPFFSTIIYIWYEDGQLRPFLVRSITRWASRREHRQPGERARRQSTRA